MGIHPSSRQDEHEPRWQTMTLDGVTIIEGRNGCPSLPLVEGDAGMAQAVVWPGVGARERTFHRFRLEGSACTRRQRHEGEAVYYVLDGTAVVREDARTEHELAAGSMVHVEPGTPYVFKAGPQGAVVVGGPCPADPSLYDGILAG